MKKHFLFPSLAILVPFLINGMANSADLWPMKIGQKFIYKRTDSANPPNSWNNEMEVIKKENVCSKEYFKIRIHNYSNEGETEYLYGRSTENQFCDCEPDSGIECCVDASAPVGTTWTCGDELSQIMETETVTVPFGGPFTAVVFRKHNEDEENLPYWYQYNYTVPGLGYVKEVDWWNDNPPITTELVEIQYPAMPGIPLLLLGE
jgi:hypothetical protein